MSSLVSHNEPVIATAEAKDALARLRAQHGDIILHITGGWSRTPLCLQANELRLGPRDVLIGEIDGVPVYEMQITPMPDQRPYGFRLELIADVPIGFSLDPGQGKRFAVREINFTA